jgi:hypothetical protein
MWFEPEDPLDETTWRAERGRAGWGPAISIIPDIGQDPAEVGWAAVELPGDRFIVHYNGVVNQIDGLDLAGISRNDVIPRNREEAFATWLDSPERPVTRQDVRGRTIGEVVAFQLRRVNALLPRFDPDTGTMRDQIEVFFGPTATLRRDRMIYDAPVGG